MPSGITIVGLGPGGAGQWTAEALQVLSSAREIWVRTARHPGVEDLARLPAVAGPDEESIKPEIHSFDTWYEESDNFENLYERIALHVVELGRREQGVIYAVPGHPAVGEATVARIRVLAEPAGLPVRIVSGLSFIEPTLAALGVDALDGLQIADADRLAALHHPLLDPDRPAVIAQLYNRRQASQVKLTLMNGYPDDHPITLVRAAGTPNQRLVTCPLYELDRQPGIDHLTTVYLPPMSRPSGFASLLETVAHLRAPEGCPWDREQTHQSLRPYLLEEMYETLAALDADDIPALVEEMGDLLLQIVLHAQIGTEEGEYGIADVIAAVDSKMHRRHPHVFGGLEVNGVSEVLVNWEAIKKAEHAADPDGRDGCQNNGSSARKSAVDGVPEAMPALARAQALSNRAVRVGFEWPEIGGVLDKVAEEATEVATAETQDERESEIGDLLFVIVNLARWLQVDAESALRTTNDRFVLRFGAMEQIARERGLILAQLDIDALDDLWDEAKLMLKKGEGGTC